MSNPQSRARSAAATQSSWTRRMSVSSIAFGTTCGSRSDASWLGPEPGHTRLRVGGVSSRVVQLDPGERAMLVRLLGHQAERAGVVVVPEPRGDQRRLVGVRRDGRVLRADRRPAALGLHAAVRRLRPRLLGPEPRAVRHLIEAVPQRLRARCEPVRTGSRGSGPSATSRAPVGRRVATPHCRPVPCSP